MPKHVSGLWLLALLFAASASAQDTSRAVHIGLGYSGGQLPGVAVLGVSGPYGDSVRAILQRDLQNGDRVTIIGPLAESLPVVDGVPNYEQFAQMGVANIVQASIVGAGEIHVAVYQVVEKRPVQTRNYTLGGAALSPDWRMDLHRAADEIEQTVTGVRGISATRIAFVRDHQIWTIDSDGADAAPLPGTRNSLSPAWDPTGRYVAFSTLPEADAGGVSMYDVVSHTTKRLTPSVRSGTYGAPSFSPDGSQLLYAYGVDGTDIYSIDPQKPGRPTRVILGKSNSSNTSAAFSPDGKKIVFVMGRTSRADVYIADADGSNAGVITDEGFGDSKNYRASPSWSPDGRVIAFQTELDGRFQIATIAPNGKNMIAITSDSENEDPFWAPDSQHLVFTSARSGTTQLWVLDTASAKTRQLTHGAKVESGSWSPPLVRR